MAKDNYNDDAAERLSRELTDGVRNSELLPVSHAAWESYGIDREDEQAPSPAEQMVADPHAPTDDVQISPSKGRKLRRRIFLPVVLFVATCLSTFVAGCLQWSPTLLIDPIFSDGVTWRRMILMNWSDGLIYMACVLAILLVHELGHFFATLIYRIPASLPFFLPFPFSPIGTLGAVIGMDGRRANRREMFDIGIAGPLAGLVVAVPILVWGILQADVAANQGGHFRFDLPLAMRWIFQITGQGNGEVVNAIWSDQLNPFLMAGWVGLLITGLNMIPISQLDGGHVGYALLGRRKMFWLVRGIVFGTIAYMLITWQPSYTLMLGLVMFVGIDHPPTSDDTAKLGGVRLALGYASLLLPIICIGPRLIF